MIFNADVAIEIKLQMYLNAVLRVWVHLLCFLL